MIILASGIGSRWKGKPPKHMIDIHGTPLIHHLYKILDTSNYKVATWNYEISNISRFIYTVPSKNILNTILQTHVSNDTGIYLLGDVLYTKESVDLIQNYDYISDFTFFGNEGEIFAFHTKLNRTNNEYMKAILVYEIKHENRIYKLRNLWQELQASKLTSEWVNLDLVDFDTVKGYEQWLQQ